MGLPESLGDLTDIQKEELVASLATLLVGSAEEPDYSKLSDVATAAGCSLSAPMATLFANTVSSVGVDKYKVGVGGGGGGGGGGGAAGGGADEAKEEEPEEEEEEAPMGGGDMFGDAGDGDY